MKELFANVVEALLAGEVICRYTREVEYTYLSDDTNFQGVSDYLWRLNRRVRRTLDENGYLLAHEAPNSPRAKLESRWMFEEMGAHIRPVIFWLALARRCDPLGRPMKAGDVLRGSELQAAVENSQEVTRELDNLCRIKPFQNENKTPSGQLSKILIKLVEMGYLVEEGHSRSQYRATAKLSLFYDLLEFIREHEGFEVDDDEAPEQLELADE